MHLLPIVVFTATGQDPAEFLTDTRDAGISIRNFHKKEDTFYGEIFAGRYHKAARIARKNGLRLRVYQRRGLWFRLWRYRRRIGLMLGAVLSLAALLFSQCFLWAIDITPTESVTEQQVRDALESHGIRIGTFLPTADLKNTSLLVRTELPGLAFFALNRVGSRIQVEMEDADPPPERPAVSGDGTCNIVASKTGLIRSIEAYRGQTMICVNQSVHQGDLLVSGVVENADGRTSYQHAAAKIMAETQLEKEFSIDLHQKLVEETGETSVRYRLDLFGKKLPLFLAFPAFQPKEPYQSYFSFFSPKLGSVTLPIGIEREELHFTNTKTVDFSEEEALTLLEEEALRFEEELEAEILSRSPSADSDGQKMTLTITYTLLEDIALEKPFERTEQN